MKLLMINSEYPPLGGGAGNATANIARVLARENIEIKVITVHFDELPRYEKNNGFEIHRISALRKRMDRSGPFEQISFCIFSIIFCFKLFRIWKPNIITAFFGIPNGLTALFLKLVFKIPYIVSLRGGDVPGFRPYNFGFYHLLLTPLIKIIWREADAVVANSDGLKKLAQNFYPKQKILTIPNGVDLDFFRQTERDWSTANIIFLGRVVYQKGLDILIEALKSLTHLEWNLSIVGDGSFKKALISQVKECKLAQRVHFIGWQTKDKLPYIYSQATIFVYPSRHEGMPNSVLEAMASGLPIIATDIAGNEELVANMKNGILVPSEDPSALANALEMLINDAKKRKTMGQESRRIVEKYYSWEKTAAQYMKIMKSQE